MPKINKELLDHLADLSRLKLGKNKDKMLDDFKDVVKYFEKLDEPDIDEVEAMSGGTRLVNKWRNDSYDDEKRIMPNKALDQFPHKKDGYNKIPPVF